MTRHHKIWPVLQNAVWHVTSPERFLQILDCQALLPEPDIPERERWTSGTGPDHYPFVRSIGGISLFDFRDFDPVAHARLFPGSSWPYFMKLHSTTGPWHGAVWLRLSVKDIAARMIWGRDLMIKRHQDAQQHRLLMPPMECAHIGPLAFSNITLAVMADCRCGETIHTVPTDNLDALHRMIPSGI